jgi:hypothetical protein
LEFEPKGRGEKELQPMMCQLTFFDFIISKTTREYQGKNKIKYKSPSFCSLALL